MLVKGATDVCNGDINVKHKINVQKNNADKYLILKNTKFITPFLLQLSPTLFIGVQ